MPIFTPVRRWQPAYRPFKHDPLPDRVLEGIERVVKGPLFGCRMCGNCLLQETAFICPMECPKGLRNGPCGGSTPEHCYVDETRACVWYRIYERALRMGREERLMEVLPPLDWEKVGSHTWMDVVHQWQTSGGSQGDAAIAGGRPGGTICGVGEIILRCSPADLVAGRCPAAPRTGS